MRFASIPNRFVRSGGAEYIQVKTLAATASAKHSRRPSGLTNQAATSARNQQAAVKSHASRRSRRPAGSGLPGFASRSTSRSQIWFSALLAAFSVAAITAPRTG